MKFSSLIIGLVLAQGAVSSADQMRAGGLDLFEPWARTTASSATTSGTRVDFEPSSILSESHERLLHNAEPSSRVQKILMAEAVKPTEVAKPGPSIPRSELPRPAGTAHPIEASPEKTALPTEANKADEAPSPTETIQPIVAARPAELTGPETMVVPTQSDQPSATINKKAEETKWVVSETTSPVDYSPLVIATIWPRQPINGRLNGLTISCRAKQIALSLRFMDDLDVPRWGGILVDSQIGDQRPVKQLWVWDEQQGTILVYGGDPIALLQSIPDGDRLRLGVGDSKGARHIATYQLVGLDAIRKKVAGACPWSSTQASSERLKP
jgi:hypothetical protein